MMQPIRGDELIGLPDVAGDSVALKKEFLEKKLLSTYL